MELSPARRVNSFDEIVQAGDYWRNGDTLWFWLPKNDPRRSDRLQMCRITQPTWTFTEQEDGSLEVRASIFVGKDDPVWSWHGYLDAGNVWREV